MEVIFEAFKQVDGSISRRYGGTGLGLSISRELASLIGGELRVESIPFEGAVFSLYFPVVLKNSTAESLSKSPNDVKENINIHKKIEGKPVLNTSHRKKTMLIIEDDSEFSSILVKFFQKKVMKVY